MNILFAIIIIMGFLIRFKNSAIIIVIVAIAVDDIIMVDIDSVFIV